jgi:hypothetical protein
MEGKAPILDRLHEREIAILQRLAAGLPDQQIADELCLSLHTVKWYNRQIYGKLGVKSRTRRLCAPKTSVYCITAARERHCPCLAINFPPKPRRSSGAAVNYPK